MTSEPHSITPELWDIVRHELHGAAPYDPLKRPRDLLTTLCGWSDSEFAAAAMGEDGEIWKGGIEGVLADLIERADRAAERIAKLEEALRAALSTFADIGNAYGNGADAAYLMHRAATGETNARAALSEETTDDQ